MDPKPKQYESPYACLGNSPISVRDPNGADSIFYNQNGTENRRVKMEGNHTYFLMHQDGNISINGNNYFQGFSYYSFFGDADRFKEPTMFTSVDREKFPDLKKETIERLVKMRYTGQYYYTIWWNSGRGEQFDYKNSPYFNPNGKYDWDASNITTAYLIDGKLYNRNEMGLLLWGGAMGETQIDYTGLYLDNKGIHNVTEGNNDELNEMNAWRIGFRTIRDAKDVNKYTNTYMIGIFGLHYDYQTPGVDPTNKNGIYEDDWKILNHPEKKKANRGVNGIGYNPY